jgi:hypothetical protein
LPGFGVPFIPVFFVFSLLICTFSQFIFSILFTLWSTSSVSIFGTFIGVSVAIALLLRTSGEWSFGILRGIGREGRNVLFIGFADAVEDPLLLPGNVRRVGVNNIKSPFTLGHLPAQLASELLLRQRSNVIHALHVIPFGALATAFSWLRVEDGVAYYLSTLDHVDETMFDTFAQVILPLFIGFKGTSICANGRWRWRCRR